MNDRLPFDPTAVGRYAYFAETLGLSGEPFALTATLLRKAKGTKLHTPGGRSHDQVTSCGEKDGSRFVDVDLLPTTSGAEFCSTCAPRREGLFPVTVVYSKLMQRLGDVEIALRQSTDATPTWDKLAALVRLRGKHATATIFTHELSLLDPRWVDAAQDVWVALQRRLEERIATWRSVLDEDPSGYTKRVAAQTLQARNYSVLRQLKRTAESGSFVYATEFIDQWATNYGTEITPWKAIMASVLRDHPTPTQSAVEQLRSRTPLTEATDHPVTWLRNEWHAQVEADAKALCSELDERAAELEALFAKPPVVVAFRSRRMDDTGGTTGALVAQRITVVTSENDDHRAVICDPLTAQWLLSNSSFASDPVKLGDATVETVATAVQLWAPYSQTALSEFDEAFKTAKAIHA